MCPEMVNRKTPILLHDNARPYVAQQTLEKMNNLKFETLLYPLYSSYLSPIDYHFFQSLDHFLYEKVLRNKHSPKKCTMISSPLVF